MRAWRDARPFEVHDIRAGAELVEQLRTNGCRRDASFAAAVYRAGTMSRLAYQSDDYPEASKKHLDDAIVLGQKGRYDGSVYLTGYVIECSFKSVLLHEASWDEHARDYTRRRLEQEYLRINNFRHQLRDLFEEVTRVYAAATKRSSRYLPNNLLSNSEIWHWKPSLRYRPLGYWTKDRALGMVTEARRIYNNTIGQMWLDQVL